MIITTKSGDITSPKDNPYGDIIIGMNTELRELTKLARDFVGGSLIGPVDKGTVLTFKYDEFRRLHMVVVHDLHATGWEKSPQYLRLGLDKIWADSEKEPIQRQFTIVQIGSGLVGKKYNARPAALEKAMNESHLPVTLFKNGETATAAAYLPLHQYPLQKVMTVGSRRIQHVAA